jgi:hypothetical protein
MRASGDVVEFFHFSLFVWIVENGPVRYQTRKHLTGQVDIVENISRSSKLKTKSSRPEILKRKGESVRSSISPGHFNLYFRGLLMV